MRAAGQGEEFGQLMEGLLAGLYRVARALTDQQADAEDLVQTPTSGRTTPTGMRASPATGHSARGSIE